MNKNKQLNILDLRDKFVFSDVIGNFLFDLVVDLENDLIVELKNSTCPLTNQNVFSLFIKDYIEKFLYFRDINEFLNFISCSKLIHLFNENEKSTISPFNKKHKFVLEYRHNVKDETKWCRASVYFFKFEERVFAYLTIEDIDDWKKRNAELIFKAEHDSLTKLKNKAATESEINKYLATQGVIGVHALFCFDIDNFKTINTAFGHIFGDVFLVQSANAIKRLFRKDDIIGRIGGDEFIIFMKDIGQRQIAMRRAEEMIEAVKNAFVEHGEAFNTTISIGISFYDNNNKSYNELLKEADTAMYHCKNQGKNRFAAYNEEMDYTTFTSHTMTQLEKTQSESNASEYIFRVLRDNKNKGQAFNLALELISYNFDIDNVAIFDIPTNKFSYFYSKKGDGDYNAEALLRLAVDEEYLKNFNDGMLVYSKNESEIDSKTQKYFDNSQIISAVHCVLMQNATAIGVVCFNRYNTNRKFLSNDNYVLRNIANLLYCKYVF